MHEVYSSTLWVSDWLVSGGVSCSTSAGAVYCTSGHKYSQFFTNRVTGLLLWNIGDCWTHTAVHWTLELRRHELIVKNTKLCDTAFDWKYSEVWNMWYNVWI